MSLKKSHLKLLFYISFSICLILNSDITVLSLEKSIQRCVHSLLPSIFPFLILSKQMSQFIYFPDSFSQSKFCRYFCPNKDILSIIPISALTGYPVSASLLNEKYKNKKISYSDFEKSTYLLNGASPSFYTFFVGNVFFGSLKEGFLLYVCQFLSVILLLKSCRFSAVSSSSENKKAGDLSVSIKEAASSFILICSTSIYFTLLSDVVLNCFSALKLRNLLLPLCAITEVTNGVFLISDFSQKMFLFLLCFICSSGGISAFYQIKSVCMPNEISIKRYFKTKLLISTIMFGLYNIFSLF